MLINQLEKMMGGLVVCIMELDPYRPPINTGLSPYSLKIGSELLSKQEARSYFLENNIDLSQNIRENLKPFFEKVSYPFTSFEISSSQFLIRHLMNSSNSRKKTDLFQMTKTDLNYIFKPYLLLLIFYIFLIIIVGPFVSSIPYLIIFLIIFPSSYLFFIWIFSRRRRIAGEKYDKDIKKSVQELIDYGVEFVKKNELDPNDFPIKLRHNDYEGLKYEKKGENDYIGFIDR